MIIITYLFFVRKIGYVISLSVFPIGWLNLFFEGKDLVQLKTWQEPPPDAN